MSNKIIRRRKYSYNIKWYLLKKIAHKCSHAVHTCVVQGSAVYICDTIWMFKGTGQQSTLSSLREETYNRWSTFILAFSFKTFFKTMVQGNRTQTKTQIEKRSLQGIWGQTTKEERPAEKEPWIFSKTKFTSIFWMTPTCTCPEKDFCRLSTPPPPWGPRWMKTDFRDLSRMGRYWNLDIARWRNLGEHSGLPIEIPVEQVMPSK